MIHPVEYCKCGKELFYIIIILKKTDKQFIAERKPICLKCLEPIEIDLKRWK